MHRWWERDPEERFWLEITDRSDLGVDLKAPQLGDGGAEVWSYSLVSEVKEGDLVFHYWKPKRAIWAVSRAVGEPWEEDIVWASHGVVAREAGVRPYRRPGWRIGLEDFAVLEQPVSLAELRAREPLLRDVVGQLISSVGTPTYFPLALSDLRPPRMQQAYLTKLPARLVAEVPELQAATQVMDASDLPYKQTARQEVGAPYRPADELTSTSERDAFAVDPAIVERGIRGHAATQNALASWVRSLGLEPRSPRPDEPNFDLAWTDGGTTWVAEVKSTTLSNEEKQLRLGLGQVLRYRQVLADAMGDVRAVLAVERTPSDSSWVALCSSLGVSLVWPDQFD